jgi:hypothetical protein
MSISLDEYNKKSDFDATPEPSGAAPITNRNIKIEEWP